MSEDQKAMAEKLFLEGRQADGFRQISFYKKAAKLGSVDAMERLSDHYGWRKPKKAYEWCKMAAKAGSPEAQLKLCEEDRWWGVYGFLSGTEALSWCRKAAENGYTKAMMKLSEIYCEGEMTKKDLVQSFEWCKKAAEVSPWYSYDIASKYFYGTGTPVDREKAWEWIKDRRPKPESYQYEREKFWNKVRLEHEKKERELLIKQAETDDVTKQLEIGKKLLNKDAWEAYCCLEKAAKQGSGEAMLLLGDMYVRGNGVTANQEKAAAWYQKAVHQGVPGAKEKLSVITEKMERFCDCLKRGQEGDPEALADLVRYSEEGIGTPKNEDNASYFALRVAANDFPEYLPQLPEVPEASIPSFIRGRETERRGRDFNRAAEYYVEAATYGNAEAMRRLANLYRRVIYDYTFEPGNVWWERAKTAGDPFATENIMAIAMLADQGDPEACVYLGNVYLYYRRDSIRHSRAEQLGLFWKKKGAAIYRQRANSGDGEAQYQLYLLYDTDELKNEEQKMYWANQAISSHYARMLYTAASDQTFDFADIPRPERIAYAKEAYAAGIGAAETLIKLFRLEAERDAMFAEFRQAAQPRESVVEEEMRKYRQDLDERERLFNLIIGQGYETNEESFYVYGKKSMKQYLEDGWPRDMLESMHRKKLEEYYR